MQKNTTYWSLGELKFPFYLQNEDKNFCLKIALIKDSIILLTIINVVRYDNKGNACGRLSFEFFENDKETVEVWLRNKELKESNETLYNKLLTEYKIKSQKVA